MKISTATLFTGALMLLVSACTPGTEAADAGLRDVGTLDSMQADTMAADSAVTDQGLEQDAAVADATVSDHGIQTDSALADAGQADAASCEPVRFMGCDGVAASGHAYTLSVAGRSLSGTHSVNVGDSFATVQAEMTGEAVIDASFNTFAKVYCAEGLIFYFADTLGDTEADGGIGANVGVLSDDDVLYKMTAFGNFAGSTDTSPALSLGNSLSDVGSALPAADVSGALMGLDGSDGQLLYHHSGDAEVLRDQALSSLSVFAPQQAGSMDADIDFAAGQIGAVTVSYTEVFGAPVPTGSSISQIKSAVGANPEALGDINVSISGNPLAFFVVSYSVLGLRFSGYASLAQQGAGDERKAMTAFITPPFQGHDSNGIGIGSSRSEVEAVFGSSTGESISDSGTVMYKYQTGSRKTGVVYARDAGCIERAVTFVVNLID